jgi:divalent metal cation (Fe/Co/Zn/Cd) transporter
MFKRVINTKGFWKSVFSLAIAFAILFALIKWAIEGFELAYFTERNPTTFIITLIVAGFIYGFFVTFGKFRSKLKENEPRQ